MASTAMPPPPTPFAHRRTPRLVTANLLASPASPDSSACLRKMSLPKGATFHEPSSPPTADDPVISIPHLTRRSPTCSQATFLSWLSDKPNVEQSIVDFDQVFSGARGKKSSTRRRPAPNAERYHHVRRVSLPTDEGIGSTASSPGSDKELSQKFERALDSLSNKDSGIGTSIGSPVDKSVEHTSEEDGLVRDLIQETDSSEQATSRQNRQRGNRAAPRSSNTGAASAVTQSIAPPRTRLTSHPRLSNFARRKIKEYIITPILNEDRFKDLHSLVTTLASKSNEAVRCLRDLERSLIFQPLSLNLSHNHYRVFGEFTIQLVVDTYQHLAESDQRRATDRPYDNGYFLDLVQQVNTLAGHIRTSTQAGPAEDDDMAYSPSDEITLEGGLGQTGEHAELVRWKNGKGISLRTNQPYEPTPGIKRSNSTAFDEDVARSMARRKKGYIPEYVEMRCPEKGCDKVFTRKCDLSKHTKTHERPFKCPHADCKFHELGLPTEKERERHINDKHAADPQLFRCKYCEFKTKRESNCKQHMEKRHGWHYERAKGKDKAVRMTPAQTPQTPALEYSSSTQSPAISLNTWDDNSSIAGSVSGRMHGSIAGSIPGTPFDQPSSSYNPYQFQAPAPVAYSNPIFPRASPAVPYVTPEDDFNFNAPLNSYHPQQMMTPITPAYSNITDQSPYNTTVDMVGAFGKPTNQWNNDVPTPESFLQSHSRNPSISHQSPMVASASYNDLASMGSGEDFTLFGNGFGGESSNAFINPAAAQATLFPAADAEAVAPLFNDPMFYQFDDAELNNDAEFFDFEMGN